MGVQGPCSPVSSVPRMRGDRLEELFSSAIASGLCGSADDCGTFFTSLDADEDNDAATEEMLSKLFGPKPVKKTEDGSDASAADSFVARLRAAHAEAVAAGDAETASAVLDALRAEGANLGEPASREPQSQGTTQAKADASRRSCVTARTAAPVFPDRRPDSSACPLRQFQKDSPPSAPKSARPSRCPRQFHCRKSPMSARADLQAQIGEQLRHGRSTTVDPSCSSTADPVSREEEPLERPVRLGEICKVVLGGSLLEQLQDASAAAGLPKLQIEASTAGCVPALPPSELPRAAVSIIAAWMQGQMSGARAIFELGASCQGGVQQRSGLSSLSTLSAVCSFTASEAFASVGPLWTEVFGGTPAQALSKAFLTVRSEAGIAKGPITCEELHLGIRALELRALSESDSSAERLQAQVWREMFRIYLRSGASGGEEAFTGAEKNESQAAVLARVLAAGLDGLEQEVRALPLDRLREHPAEWEECTRALSAMARMLREDKEMMKTYGIYIILGVSTDASDADLKKAYRDMCLKYHPDKGGDTAAFQQLQQAYDKLLEQRKHGVVPPPPPWATTAATTKTPEGSRPTRPQREPDNQAHSGTAAGEVPPWDGRRSSAKPTDDSVASGSAAETSDASVIAAEALKKLEDLCTEVAAAAERAQASSEAAAAAAAVIESTATRSSIAEEDVATVLEAAPCFVSSLQRAAMDLEAAASHLAEISARVVPAGGLVDDGDRAEELLQASLSCSSEASAASRMASAHQQLVEDITETFQTIAADCGQDDLEEDAKQLAMQLLASAVQRGRQAASEAAEAAAQIVGVGRNALKTARGTATAESAKAQRPPRPSRSASLSRSEDKQDGPLSSPPRSRASPPRHSSSDGSGTADATRPDRLPSGSPQSRQRSFHARSASPSARGPTEALIQRRLKSFKELQELNKEVCNLQRDMHEFLVQNPLFLPPTRAQQKARIFAVLGEYMQEILKMTTGCSPRSSVQDALGWMVNNVQVETALCDIKVGALRMAAALDMKALESVLVEQFLPALVTASPDVEKGALEDTVKSTVASLRCWITSRDSMK